MRSSKTTYIARSSNEMMEAGDVEGEIKEDGRDGIECMLSLNYYFFLRTSSVGDWPPCGSFFRLATNTLNARNRNSNNNNSRKGLSYRVGKPCSDVTRRCSKHVGWFPSASLIDCWTKGTLFVHQLGEMDDFHPESRICIVRMFRTVWINRVCLPILLVVS